MGFWWFMFSMVMLIPLTMVISGNYYRNFGIKAEREGEEKPKRNRLSGYRTRRSMQSDESFIFAQRLFGKSWLKWGLVITPLSAAAMVLVYGGNINSISLYGFIITLLQVILMCICVIPVEQALKENFDENGNRR